MDQSTCCNQSAKLLEITWNIRRMTDSVLVTLHIMGNVKELTCRADGAANCRVGNSWRFTVAVWEGWDLEMEGSLLECNAIESII